VSSFIDDSGVADLKRTVIILGS